eukprot:jgi/Galph1/1184/GphlegSOOS_G5926.1
MSTTRAAFVSHVSFGCFAKWRGVQKKHVSLSKHFGPFRLRTSKACHLFEKRPKLLLIATYSSFDDKEPEDREASAYSREEVASQYLDKIWKDEEEEIEEFSSFSFEEEQDTNGVFDDELSLRKQEELVKERRVSQDEDIMEYGISLEPAGPLEEESSLPWVLTIMKAGEDRKAKDILGLWVSDFTVITSFFVNMCGNNVLQLQAISRNVEEAMMIKHHQPVKRKTGTANSGWILLDYGDVIVNIMSVALRKRYDLEKLWHNAQRLNIENVENLIQNTTRQVR